MFEKYLVKVLEFKKKNCVELVAVAELNGVISLTKLFDALATVKNGVGSLHILSTKSRGYSEYKNSRKMTPIIK